MFSRIAVLPALVKAVRRRRRHHPPASTNHCHLDKAGSTARIMLLDFSSAFNTIQPDLLCQNLQKTQVKPSTITWINDYLTNRPQFVRLKDCVSNQVVSSTGAPHGTILSPFLFTLYTSDFQFKSETCHLQKYSDDSVIVGCIRIDLHQIKTKS